MSSEDLGVLSWTMRLLVVSHGNIEEVPAHDDDQNKVNDQMNDDCSKVALNYADDQDADHNVKEDLKNVEDLVEPNDLASVFLVVFLEPFVPEPSAVHLNGT